VSLDRILKTVCKSFSLKEGELLVSGRDHKIAKARGMAAGRDVTTLSFAAKRLQIRSKSDLELAEKIEQLLDTFS
jgi:chromosomal replication initiation ATPase DnaA